MASGMWTAAAGASAQAQNLDLIANNLANADTQAFKKDLPTFKEYLATVERNKEGTDIPRGPTKDKDLYPLDGRDQSYVIMDGTHTSYRQGNLRVTQGLLDVALDGPGFLEVSTPSGTRFTREGALKIAADGRLVTKEGFPVLSQENKTLGTNPNESPVASRFINLKDAGTHLIINEKGDIYAGENLVSKLSVVEFQNLNQLKKIGNQLFEATNGNPAINSNQTLVRQGVLENSNVNPIEEMTNMIKANRLFEHDLKALKTYSDLMAKEVSEVGKL